MGRSSLWWVLVRVALVVGGALGSVACGELLGIFDDMQSVTPAVNVADEDVDEGARYADVGPVVAARPYTGVISYRPSRTEGLGPVIALDGGTMVMVPRESEGAVFLSQPNEESGQWVAQMSVAASIDGGEATGVAIDGDLAVIGEEGVSSSVLRTFVYGSGRWGESGKGWMAAKQEVVHRFALADRRLGVLLSDQVGWYVVVCAWDRVGWKQVHRLTIASREDGVVPTDVAIGGATVVVAFPSRSEVWIYREIKGVWRVEERLNPDVSNRFGSSIALDGQTLVVGDEGRGSAHIYQRRANRWALRANLGGENGGREARQAVAIDDIVVAVSEWDADAYGRDTGSVAVYTDLGGMWSFVRRVYGYQTDAFAGRALAVDAERVFYSVDQGASAQSSAGITVFEPLR